MLSIPTLAASDISAVDCKIRYDQQVKKVLANRSILACILKGTVIELMEYSLDVIERCIDNTVDISTIYVNPGETNTKINSEATTDKVDGEGRIIYDIKFSITTPDGEQRKIIINIEAQQKSNPGYDIVTRAIFYCARLVSSQLTVEFNNNGTDKTQYDGIKKVYTIWLCMDCPKDKQDSILSFNWQPSIIYQGKKELSVDYRYDIMNVVIIHLSKLGETSEDKLIGMLDTLLDYTMAVEEKKKRLNDVHGLPMSIELEKEVMGVCNLSDGIEARGIARGEKNEGNRNILKLLNKNKTVAEIVDLLDYSLERVTKVAKANGFITA